MWTSPSLFRMNFINHIATYFTFSDVYDLSDTSTNHGLCGSNATTCSEEFGLSNYVYVFYLGQFVHGLGAAPLYTLGVTYLDDNLPVKSTSLYHGECWKYEVLTNPILVTKGLGFGLALSLTPI